MSPNKRKKVQKKNIFNFDEEVGKRKSFIESFRVFEDSWKKNPDEFISSLISKYASKFKDEYGSLIIKNCIDRWNRTEELLNELETQETKKNLNEDSSLLILNKLNNKLDKEETGMTLSIPKIKTETKPTVPMVSEDLYTETVKSKNKMIDSLMCDLDSARDELSFLKSKKKKHLSIFIVKGIISFAIGFFVCVLMYNYYN